MAFILAAAMVVAGFVAVTEASAAFAQENPPAPTAAPQDDTSDGEAVVPATEGGEPNEAVIAPTPDEDAPEGEQAEPDTGDGSSGADILIAPAPQDGGEQGLIAPAGDEGAQEREQAKPDTADGSSDTDTLIAPAGQDGGEQGLIAPAGDEGDDSGTPSWVYALVAVAGLTVVGGAGGLVWRLHRQRA
jgi:hypothetical protein